ATFGRPERVTACACERNDEVTLPQLLHLLNGTGIVDKVRSPACRLAGWLKEQRTDEAIIDEMFLLTVSRPPPPPEWTAIRNELAKRTDGREEVFRDVLWALCNSKEFIFDH